MKVKDIINNIIDEDARIRIVTAEDVVYDFWLSDYICIEDYHIHKYDDYNSFGITFQEGNGIDIAIILENEE
jgi:hypothetical protein